MTTGLEFKVFHGVGAVIAKVTSHSKFSVLAIVNEDRVDFSATERLFEVDLDATPSTVGAPDPVTHLVTRWSDVRFDDRGVDRFDNELRPAVNAATLSVGITTLGSPRVLSGGLRDLTVGAFVGAVYVEHALFRQIAKSALTAPGSPPWPEGFFKLHEITSITYSRNKINGARAGLRYHGFEARVVNVLDGGAAIEVEFPHPGQVALGPLTLRLDDPRDCDRDPPPEALGGVPSLTTDPTAGAQGPLFVALPRAAAMLATPKMPLGQG